MRKKEKEAVRSYRIKRGKKRKEKTKEVVEQN